MSQHPLSPQPLAYAVRDPRDVDREHLKALAICHYIAAALTALFACFGLLYVAMGAAFATGSFKTATTMPTPSPFDERTFGAFFIIFGCLFCLIGWTLAACTLVSGLSIRKRKRRMFSIVMAAINCAIFPFGTILGVFTLMVLLRDSVRNLYEQTTPPA